MVFTNIMVVALPHLRKQGHLSSGYLDDFFLLWTTVPICSANNQATAALLMDLGFTLNNKKSETTLIQILEHLFLWFSFGYNRYDTICGERQT